MKKSNPSSENLKKMQEEIVRLEYLNNFLTLSLQKRDEMLAHLMEENRKLKEVTIFFERTFSSLNKTHTLSPRKVIKIHIIFYFFILLKRKTKDPQYQTKFI